MNAHVAPVSAGNYTARCNGGATTLASYRSRIWCTNAATIETEGKQTLRELCGVKVPINLIDRAESVGFKYPTQVQKEALPIVLDGHDCLIHSQTGSGKTLAYLLPILSKTEFNRSSVQALIVVPTRELGVQVAKVARTLGGGIIIDDTSEIDTATKTSISVMTLLDGGVTTRQKKWLKAAPPQLVIGTLFTICRMIETKNLKTHAIATIVIDEVDTAVHKQIQNLLQDLLTKHTVASKRQTLFASATVPQHRRFMHDCVQNKWTKTDLVHVNVQPEEIMPSNLCHRYKVCDSDDKLEALFALLLRDSPQAAFIFANELSEKAKREGAVVKTRSMMEFFEEKKKKNSDEMIWELLMLDEEMGISARYANSKKLKEKEKRFLLFATDLAARGLDVPEVTHIYNLELPSTTVSYIHRAGRTARKPMECEQCIVTTLVTKKEEMFLQKLANEISCHLDEI